MKPPNRPTFRVRLPLLGVALAVAPWLPAGPVAAQPPPPVPAAGEGSRMDRLEDMVRSLAEENRRLSGEVRELRQQLGQRPPAPTAVTPPLPSPIVDAGFPPDLPQEPAWSQPVEMPVSAAGGGVLDGPVEGFRIRYDKGLAIVPENVDEVPFSLHVRSQDVFRYTGFIRANSYWIDSAGNRTAIGYNNYFGIPRGRIIFSGAVLLPRLSYLLNIDYNSVTTNPIGFRAYELSYRFSKAFVLSIGQNKVPGTREWLESAFAPLQGPDRSMATTFFRPSLSQGIWFTGQPAEGWNYHAMVSNGFNTLNQLPDRLNNRFCWSGSAWWEPWGAFGAGYSDIQAHDEAALRLGASYTYAIGRGNQADSDAVENSPVRLSDGTIITTPGALAPNVTVQTYDISLAAIDLAYKRRGLGLSTELYFQELLGLRGNGPLPIRSTRAFGGFLQGGYFIVPRRTELYARTSYVSGDFGGGYELGGGLNWFILRGKENFRYTFDAAWLNHSPAGQTRTGYVAGETGLLLRTQVTIVY